MARRTHSQLPYAHVYCNGFPCQPWSLAGKILGMKDPRARIVRSLIKTMRSGKIKRSIIENVPRLMAHKKGSTLKALVQQPKQAGFRLDKKICNLSCNNLPTNSALYSPAHWMTYTERSVLSLEGRKPLPDGM